MTTQAEVAAPDTDVSPDVPGSEHVDAEVSSEITSDVGSSVSGRFDLPSGGWAEFRDPEMTTAAQRKPLTRWLTRLQLDPNLQAAAGGIGADTLDGMQLSDAQLDVVQDYSAVLAAVLLSGWSFDLPLTVEGLQSIGVRDFEAIVTGAGKHERALLPSSLLTEDDDTKADTEADAVDVEVTDAL